jgi:hypothetical protein
MKTLVILGSKPQPALPAREEFDDVACANASGYSAASLGLATPVFTVMTSMLASGITSGQQSLQALRGLETEKVYFLRRRTRGTSLLKRALFHLKNIQKKSLLRMQPLYLERVLRALPYGFAEFEALREAEYDGLVRELCSQDSAILSQMERKRPSTGVIAVALALARYRYDRYVISGFSFELSHAYGRNPEIDERGTAVSAHASTDIMVLRHLGQKITNLYTSEPLVHERTGLPILDGPGNRKAARRQAGQ